MTKLKRRASIIWEDFRIWLAFKISPETEARYNYIFKELSETQVMLRSETK